ncbi:hypothetical protein DX933_15560 [Ornithinibacillus gellani]|uniref:hypothetical protein n=1 Tax=Ornithinibacillus gellani TaxID=2293253 RepID=UPI000F4A6247|nr:hypothetical protein [Ornithinibacillus gellani]TQS71983.1 hypothetical protein DX933_15560 [Ornithinibacillus gellani]
MKIRIAGKDITNEQLTEWKKQRIKKVFKIFHYKTAELNDPDMMIEKLAEIKMGYSYQEMYSKLESKLKLSEFMMRMGATLSGNRRKFSQTEIYLDGLTAAEAIEGIDNQMLNSSIENNRINLSACPDHYALRPLGENELEVIETTGNAPVPVQFFIVFDDETGLQTPRDQAYAYQSVGVARMKDGTVIGGVRHQIKDTETGMKIKLSVEFPALAPTSIIKSHQMHLACEFSYWLQWIKAHKNNHK